MPATANVKKTWLHVVAPVVGVLIFLLALVVLHHELAHVHIKDIIRQLRDLPRYRVVLALSLTAAAYIVLTGYDLLGMRYIGRTLSAGKVMFAAFLSFVFSNNVGLSILGASAVRFRMYTAWGLSPVEVVKLVVFTGVAYWLGILALAGAVFLVHPMALPEAAYLPIATVRPLGIVFLTLVVGYVVLCIFVRGQVHWKSWEFALPRFSLGVAQPIVGALDWAMAATVLYALLPKTPGLTLTEVYGAFMLAQVAGLISHSPAGLGVFEVVMIAMLKPVAQPDQVLSAILVYRLIYYVLPLLVGVGLMAIYEVRQRRHLLARIGQRYGRWIEVLVPHVLAVTSFVSGAIVLFAGAAPEIHERLKWLVAQGVPLVVCDISHALASVVGMGLMLSARGLQRRLTAAYRMTAVLLVAGIVLALAKGMEYELALVLAVTLLALVPSHDQFYRRGRLVGRRFVPGWTVATVLILIMSIWLGIFAYKNEAYTLGLLVRMSVAANAPRFWRASAAAVLMLIVAMVAKLRAPHAPRPQAPEPDVLAAALPIVQASRRTYANLVLLADKQVLFTPERAAFLMFAPQRHNWIAMGEPVGPYNPRVELAWQFRELCDRYSARPVFYQIGSLNLPLFLDLGLTLLRLGDEARLSLVELNVPAPLAEECRAVEGAGCRFQVHQPQELPDLVDELRVVSGAWLAAGDGLERRFAVGSFSETYLAHFPLAVVRQGGRIIAFANVWQSGEQYEAGADLLRYGPDAPPNVMTYLLVMLARWAEAEGYRWFNLGVAPSLQLEEPALAPLWQRLGPRAFLHGAHFETRRALRRYKERFAPTWEARYLASPGGLALPEILEDVAALIIGREDAPPRRRRLGGHAKTGTRTGDK